MKMFLVAALSVVAVACSSSSGTGGTTGNCTGDITQCPLGTLSSSQKSDACDAILAAISDPAGTKYTCNSGANSGAYISVSTTSACIATNYQATCPLTEAGLIACYKAAAMDACGALASDGACAFVADSMTVSECSS